MEEALLKQRFIELAQRAYDGGQYTYTNFLNLMELDVFAHVENRLRHVPYTLWGGAHGCERKLIRFGNIELCGYEEDMPIACVRIQPVNAKFSDALTHRDFLGAIMNLGIERDATGDIRLIENKGYIFCLTHIAPYIIEQLTKVRHTTVTCAIIPELPMDAVQLMENASLQVASERLDIIVARLYKLSRAEGQELFRSGRVFVNDKLQQSSSCMPKVGDIISVRGYGRFLYSGVSGMTKKGKCIVLVVRYA